MINDTFQIDRFYKLTKRKWTQPSNFALRNVLTILALPLFFLLINLLDNDLTFTLSVRTKLLMAVTVLTFILSPFIYFFTLNHPKKGFIEALLPASNLEKYLVMQLTCIVFAPVFVFALMGGMDTILSLLFPKQMEGLVVMEIFQTNTFNWESVIIVFVVQQAVLLCNLLFRRYKLLKTFAAFMLAEITIITLLIISFMSFIPDFANLDGHEFQVYSGRGDSLLIHAGDHPAVIIIQLFRIFFEIVLPILLVIYSFHVLSNKKY